MKDNATCLNNSALAQSSIVRTTTVTISDFYYATLLAKQIQNNIITIFIHILKMLSFTFSLCFVSFSDTSVGREKFWNDNCKKKKKKKCTKRTINYWIASQNEIRWTRLPKMHKAEHHGRVTCVTICVWYHTTQYQIKCSNITIILNIL